VFGLFVAALQPTGGPWTSRVGAPGRMSTNAPTRVKLVAYWKRCPNIARIDFTILLSDTNHGIVACQQERTNKLFPNRCEDSNAFVGMTLI